MPDLHTDGHRYPFRFSIPFFSPLTIESEDEILLTFNQNVLTTHHSFLITLFYSHSLLML
jgi:hypothetical protein